MFTSYRESVLDYMGADGTLALKIIEQLLDDHGALDEIEEFRQALGDQFNDAEALLDYMGY